VKKRSMAALAALFPLTLIMNGCPDSPADEDETEFIAGNSKVSAYIRTWSLPAAAREGSHPYWKAGMIKGEYLSDLIIAFALINSTDGYSLFIPEVNNGFALWTEVAALKAKYPHIKVKFSVGGGSAAGLAGYSEMAADPDLRAKFTANVCKWLEDYDLDGVDIDWEYPVGAEWSGYYRPEDRENYITLLQGIRDAADALGEKTGKRYLLSSAIPASNWFIQRNDVKAAAEIVDGLKLMTYDYHGSWSRTTGHNANIYRDSSGWSTNQSVNAYLRAQVPPEKIIIGVPFYGQVWRGVPEGNKKTPGLFQTPAGFVNTISWYEIKRNYLSSGYKRYWDDTAKAPYLYNGDRWISYTDQDHVKALTNYVKENELGGLFVWEYAHDMDADLLKTLAVHSQ